MQRKIWARLIGTIIALVVVALVGFKTYYYFHHKAIKNVVTETLTLIQKQEYAKAEKNFHFHFNQEGKKRLTEITKLLQSTTWQVEYVYPDLFEEIVLVYMNEEVGSITGHFEQVVVSKDSDGNWRIGLQYGSLFSPVDIK